MFFAAVLMSMVFSGYQTVFAQSDEPTIYVINKGDTLWGLSERFLKDPFYWPDLWARNQQQITNPHLIFPGQKLRIYPDRIEVEEAPGAKGMEGQTGAAKETKEMKEVADKVAQERSFSVNGGEGFLLEKDLKPAGVIIATNQNRQIVGQDDIVYTDIGSVQGGKVGERFSIFKKMNAVSHPVTNDIIGYRVVPQGVLQLSEMEETTSKAIITKSFMETGVGAYLMPYREQKREVSLRVSDLELTAYIVETLTGNQQISAGDIVYLDLGKAHGIKTGNMLYVVRDVEPEQELFDFRPLGKLPPEVLGAVVVVDTGESTSTALVVKSIDTIYIGDRVELKKSK
jgi:LysM repeat protein